MRPKFGGNSRQRQKGFLEFLPDSSISIRVHPRAILSLSPGLLRSEELGVIQIRLIPVIFQSFIRRRRAAGGGRGDDRGKRSPRG